MPVIKSAKKKLRQDKKRSVKNAKFKKLLSEAIKKAGKKPSEKTILIATKTVDKAAKNKIIHKNKAARIKSRLSKLMPAKKTVKPVAAKKPKSKKTK
ncbi:MAG: 30S ribosomal protein S20 [Patescibacteria group bacterium]|nr:30S ribosomal protein S20 [Patescibacteria group bacterium]